MRLIISAAYWCSVCSVLEYPVSTQVQQSFPNVHECTWSMSISENAQY